MDTSMELPAAPSTIRPALAGWAVRFYRLLALLSGVSMVATFVTVALGVAAREAGADIPGLDAYAGYAIAAALFLGLPETFRRGEHIRVTLMLQRLGARTRRGVELGGLAVGTVLAAYLAWFACRLVWVSYLTHDVSQGADVTPLWIPQLAMALGCIGFAVAFADALLAQWQGRAFFIGNQDITHVE